MGRTLGVAREFGGETAGVIVVDNSPGDGAAGVVRAAVPDACVITNPVNRGYAAAVNQALANARADVVLLLNPDVERIAGRYADVVDAFRDPRVAAVVTRTLDADGSVTPNCFRAPRPFDLIAEDVALADRFPRWQRPRRYRLLDWDYRSLRQVDAATGACLFLRRSALADVGPFDERFFVYYEETDWMVRAKRRGWRTVFVPTVEAVHASGGSSPGVRSRASLLLLESQHRYARKHFGRTTGAALRVGLIGLDAARAARHTVGGDRERRAAAARPHPAAHHDASAASAVRRRCASAVRRVARGDTRLPIGSGWRPAPATSSRRQSGSARGGGGTAARAPCSWASSAGTASWWRSCPCTFGDGAGCRCFGSPVTAPATSSGPCARRSPTRTWRTPSGAPSPPSLYRRFVLLAELVPSDHRFGSWWAGERFTRTRARSCDSRGVVGRVPAQARGELPPAGAPLSPQAGRGGRGIVSPLV